MNSRTRSLEEEEMVRDKPWLQAEMQLYRQSGFCIEIDTNDDEANKEDDEDSGVLVPALMATQVPSNDPSDSSSYDSWAERTVCSDDSIPFGDVVRSDTDEDENDNDETRRSEFMNYLETLSLATDNSLDSFPEPHEVSDQELLRRMMVPGEYTEDGRRAVTDMLQRVLGITNEDVVSYDRMTTTTVFNEEKLEVFDTRSTHILTIRYYVNEILTFQDYRMSKNFSLLLVCRQREVLTSNSLVAIEFLYTALSGRYEQDVLSDEIWIGDTGASCHMCTSMWNVRYAQRIRGHKGWKRQDFEDLECW